MKKEQVDNLDRSKVYVCKYNNSGYYVVKILGIGDEKIFVKDIVEGVESSIQIRYLKELKDLENFIK